MKRSTSGKRQSRHQRKRQAVPAAGNPPTSPPDRVAVAKLTDPVVDAPPAIAMLSDNDSSMKTPADGQIKISDLRPAPYNPRKISKEQLKRLAKAMAEFGDLSGVVVNRKTGNIVGGHQRVKIFQKDWPIVVTAKYAEPNAVGTVAEGYVESPWGRWIYREVDWPEQHEMAANIAANKHGGEFDIPKLKDILTQLDDGAFDLELTGFDAAELKGLIDWQGNLSGKKDEVPEPPKVAVTKPGDLLELGAHRLLCGDASKPEDVGRLLQGQKAILMATDPPYGIAYTDDARVAAERAHGRQRRMPKWSEGIDNDEKTDADIQPFLESCFRPAKEIALLPNAAWYLWHAHLTQGFFAAAAAAAAADLILHRQIIWVKPSLLFGFGDYHWRHELCFYGWVKGNRPPFYGERNQTTIWEIKHEASNCERVHPTQKPVEIFRIPILNHTKQDEICYEPFSGSGTQIIAAEMTGRRCFAMEIEPRFCDVAVTRWEAFTNKKAMRIEA